MKRYRSPCVVRPFMTGSFVVALVASALVATSPIRGASPVIGDTVGGDTVARFLESGHPPLTTYRARRHLEASTRSGKLSAQLDAWTDLSKDGRLTFEIVAESGSDLIRERVLRAALLEEQRSRAETGLAESALTPENYDFLVDNTTLNGELVRIALAPRRKSQTLIAGDAFVRRDDADLVSVEGVLAKRLSFWTRTVHITRRYARVGGVRVPIEMRSRADVLIAGDSSFSMTYKYSAINGRTLGIE